MTSTVRTLGTAVAFAVVLVACGDDADNGGDGRGGSTSLEAAAEGFEVLTREAYASQGQDREERAADGLARMPCFALSEDDMLDVAETAYGAGVDATDSDDAAFIQGPPGAASINCLFRLDDGAITLTVATHADQTADELREPFLDRYERDDLEPEDGSAPGLDDNAVAGLCRPEFCAFGWFTDGFTIQIALPDLDDTDAGYQALGVAVSSVLAQLENAA